MKKGKLAQNSVAREKLWALQIRSLDHLSCTGHLHLKHVLGLMLTLNFGSTTEFEASPY